MVGMDGDAGEFTGFSEADFDVFGVPGLEPRMALLRERVTPKLARLGAVLAPELSRTLGRPMHAHVARHARRTVNPPNDTWVALSQDPRGYKKWPSFMVGLWHTHVFAQFGVIYESPLKGAFAQALAADWDRVKRETLAGFTVSDDYMTPGGSPADSMTQPEFSRIAQRVATRKNGDLLFGRSWSREDALSMPSGDLLSGLVQACRDLAPLYEYAFAPDLQAAARSKA